MTITIIFCHHDGHTIITETSQTNWYYFAFVFHLDLDFTEYAFYTQRWILQTQIHKIRVLLLQVVQYTNRSIFSTATYFFDLLYLFLTIINSAA